MSGSQHSSIPNTGHQSRRWACDRCREQKLRCVYQDPDSHTCERCDRAKVACTYDMPKGMARPRRVDDTLVKENASVTKARKLTPASQHVSDQDRSASCNDPTPNQGTGNQITTTATALSEQHASDSDYTTMSDMPLMTQDWLMSLENEDPSFILSGEDFGILEPFGLVSDPIHQANQLQNMAAPQINPNLQATSLSLGLETLPAAAKPCGNFSTTPEAGLKQFYDLDLRLYKLSVLMANIRDGLDPTNGNATHGGPVSEVLLASQDFIDLLDSVATPKNTDSPTFLLISTLYTRLLGIYTELISMILANIGPDTSLSSSPYSNSSGMVIAGSDSSSSSTASSPRMSDMLFSGLGIQLAGLNVQSHNNLQLRILVQTCTYMLDRIDSVLREKEDNHNYNNDNRQANFASETQGSRWGSMPGFESPPRPSIMDIVTLAVRHDDIMSQETGKRPISRLNGSIQRLNSLLRMV